MTEITFHFNTPDKVAYACRLLRKATASGAKSVVVTPAHLVQPLDLALWTFSELAFLPHCLATDAPALLSVSPVVLVEPEALKGTELPHHDVMIHLGRELPAGFERFERLIELVDVDEQDRQQARLRWKHYADRGYTLNRHDVAAQAATQ